MTLRQALSVSLGLILLASPLVQAEPTPAGVVSVSPMTPSGPVPTAAAPTPVPSAAILPIPVTPPFVDNVDQESLLLVLQRQIDAMAGKPNRSVKIGNRTTTTDQMRRTLVVFAEVVRQHFGQPSFAREVQRQFETLNQGDAYMTGYYLPLLEARTKRDAVFSLPLHSYPASNRNYSRAQIAAGALANRGLEIAWVSDAYARYSLMVQGSGLLHFEDGRTVNVNFAGSNGQAYRSLGRIFIDEGLLTEETLSWQAIVAYLQANPTKRETYFNRNPSYCFFKLSEGGPYGSGRITLTSGRSIATDKRLYPHGALAYVTVPEHGIARYAVDQDTGGAIRGQARVDVFLGAGAAAAELAGRLKHHGQLYYLLLRDPSRQRRAEGPGGGGGAGWGGHPSAPLGVPR
ncbi:MAG: MltA domain-containing protein, partial [Candidatus Sericytochromatia bacterium]|nr:MltA domain-containing protein [Candidatus Sericytochromatia bacterium]